MSYDIVTNICTLSYLYEAAATKSGQCIKKLYLYTNSLEGYYSNYCLAGNAVEVIIYKIYDGSKSHANNVIAMIFLIF
jgi:hypothetical protein